MKQFGLKYLAQGHTNMWIGGAALPPEPLPPRCPLSGPSKVLLLTLSDAPINPFTPVHTTNCLPGRFTLTLVGLSM